MIPRTFHDLSILVVVLAAGTLALLVPGVPWPIEWALGIPFVLLLPGYVLVTAMLPTPPEPRPGPSDTPGWVPRVALTLVTSVLVVALLGTGLALRGALDRQTAVVSIAGVTLLGTIVAVLRRRRVTTDRPTLPVVDVRAVTGGHDDGLARLQTVTLLLAVLALAGTLAVVGASPPSDGAYTEVYLLSPGGGDVGPTANDTTFVAEQRSTVGLGLTNHRSAPKSLGVVVQLARVGPDGAVRERERLNRFRAQLAPRENAVYEREVAPGTTGERLRLQILVYDGEIPDEPRAGTASLSLRQWVTVVDDRAT